MDADEIQKAIKIYDCPIICKSRTISIDRVTITGNKILDKALVDKHGSMEIYLL